MIEDTSIWEIVPVQTMLLRGLAIICPPARVFDVLYPANAIDIYKRIHDQIKPMLNGGVTAKKIGMGCVKDLESLFPIAVSNTVSLAIAYLGIAAIESTTGVEIIPKEYSMQLNQLIDFVGIHHLRTEYLDVVKLSLGWQALKLVAAAFSLARVPKN
ncbi:MAG: hypothetical protein Q7R95_01630 [bacterium]|nr:hypothetical protein [bacterium]